MPGALVLVVGPSGAGKDTLIDAARQRFAGRSDVIFPRRIVTRPAQAGGEDHIPIDEAAFAARERAGLFFLSWRAHGLAYAVPIEAGQALAEGRMVVVNVSRRALAQAEAKVEDVLVLNVTASPQTLLRRLAARGRESEADILLRLGRGGRVTTTRAEIVPIVNDGALEEAAAAFVRAIEARMLREQTQSARG